MNAYLCCDRVAYGIMFRDPLANARSTFVNNRFDDIDRQDIMRALRDGTFPPPRRRHSCLPDWDTVHHFDNFATRTLSGAYTLPPGSVARSQLELAKARLQQMNVVLILEDFSAHLPQLSATFGWNL